MAKRRRKSHKRRRHTKMTVVASKRRRSHRQHRVARVVRHRRYRRSHRKSRRRSSGITLRRIGGRRSSRQRYRIAGIAVARNPIGGFVRLPTMNELMWVGGAALVVPAISKLMKSPANPMPAFMKTGWGGIATELLLASVASVMVRKYVNATAGDAIFILGLANGVTQTVRQVAPLSVQEMIGITPAQVAVAASPAAGTSFYAPSRLGHVDPASAGGFGVGDGFPSMT